MIIVLFQVVKQEVTRPRSVDNCVTPVKPPGKKRGPRPKILTSNERKQKRLDANDRERQRMGQLNVAFDALRNLLPKHGNDRELSKFETIQIAKNYIKALNQMLVQADAEAAKISTPTSPPVRVA